MIELIKQGIFTGLGLLSLTKEKLMELGDQIARQAQLSEEQARQFQVELSQQADEARRNLETEIDRRIDHAFIQIGLIKAGVKKAGETARDEFQTLINQRVDAAFERLGVACAEEIDALTRRVELLEAKHADG
jgi:polyhydroxyalkanoate synthesis regulator phasin